jgi:hypothetical protein
MINRAVILGASNLSLGYPIVCRHLVESSDKPLEIYSACGHGRSYGKWSQFLYRGIPGIIQCELWNQLKIEQDKKSASSVRALITDVGNDLVYGKSVSQILEWLRFCLDQLKAYEADIIVTELPVESLMKLSRLRYELTRRLFFGGKSLCWDEMQSRILSLNEELIQLTNEYEIRLIKPNSKWYGFDPIHIKKSQRFTAWKEILTSSSEESCIAKENCRAESNIQKSVPTGLFSGRSLKRCDRAERKFFGKIKRTSQPVLESEHLTAFSF